MASELHFLGKDVFRRIRVRGDGNCLFRSMSIHLWGSEDYHQMVRQEIVDKVVRDWDEIGAAHMADFYRDDERGDSPEAYRLAMRDSTNKKYGSELEISIFCKLHDRNAIIYKLADVNRKAYDPNSKDTIFISSPIVVDEDLGSDMNVHFLFDGIVIEERAEGHFDLLEKVNVTPSSIICESVNVTKEQNEQPSVETQSNSHDLIENENVHTMGNESKTVTKSDRNKKEIGTLLKNILFRECCTYESMKKNSNTFSKIIKDCSMEIFGNDSLKHLKQLRHLYNINYLEMKSELFSHSTERSHIVISSKQDDILRSMTNIICDQKGNNITTRYVIDNAKEVFNEIVGDMLTKHGWSDRRNNGLKKCRKYYKIFLDNLVSSKAEYVSSCKYSSSIAKTYSRDLSVSDVVDLSSDGDQSSSCKSNVCTEDKTICWHCSSSEEPNDNPIAEPTQFNTDLTTWESAIAKDASLKNIKKEILSEHRRCGGVCTWTQDQIYNIPNKDSTRVANTTIVLKECMFNECSNFLKLTVNKQGNVVKVALSDHRSNCNSLYDVQGHLDSYEKQGVPFDGMDDILYNYRDWSVVFDPISVKNVLEEMSIETTEGNAMNCSEGIISQETDKSNSTVMLKKREQNEKIKREPYSRFEGVLRGDLNTISLTDKKCIEKVRMLIRKEIITQLNIHCRLIFKLWRKLKKRQEYVMYAKCGSTNKKNCKDYKLIISFEHNCIDIWSRCPEKSSHDGRPKAYQIRGVERDQYKVLLKEKTAKSVQNLDIKLLDEKARLELNMQSVRTLLSMRKCRSESFKEDDMHSDDLLDIIIMAKSETVIPVEERYIRQVTAIPLQVYLYSDGQRDLVFSKDILVAYFDATGTIVRNVPLSLEKDIYYYALVVNVNSEVIPVAELLSEIHDIPTIQNFFNTYKFYYLKKNQLKWPVIKRVVCDWSWAIIIGIIGAWNSMDLLQYLNICYKLSKNSCYENDYKHIVTVHICCAHFMKMISCNLAKHNIKRKDVKDFVMKTMAALVMCNKLTDVERIYESFAIVLLSDKMYTLTATALSNVQNIIDDTDSEITEFEGDSQNSSSKTYMEYVKGKTKVDSPFNKRFMEIVSTATEELEKIRYHGTEDKEVNALYCPSFFDYVQMHLMPLLPLWSGLMIGLHPITEKMVGRFSNSNVENYFKIVKHRLLQSKGHLKVGRVIKVLRENVATALNNIRINISEYNKESKKRKRNTHDSKRIPKMRKIAKNVGEEQLSEVIENEQIELEKVVTIDTTKIHKCDNSREDENILEKQLECNAHILTENKIDDDLPQEENSCDVDDPNLVESWMKRKKSLTTHFSTSPVSRFFKKDQVPTSITNIEDKTEDLNITTEDVNIASKYPIEKRNVFRVSLAHDYPHKEAMSNGLFLNPKYYMTDEEFVVSIFSNLSPAKRLALYTHVFSTLKGSEQLQQSAVDVCIAALIKLANNKRVKFVNTDTAHSMLRQKSSITVASNVWDYFKNLKNFDLLVMPYLVPNEHHYCLIIGDLRSKQCVFYNPLQNYPDSTQVGHEKFRTFLQQLNKTQYKSELTNVNDWTYMKGKGPIQKDSVNCGLYVVRFVECWLLTMEEMDKQIDVDEYRDYLQRLCLQQSDNMSDLCLYCGKGETRCKIWVMCHHCKRWAHYKPCLKYLDLPQSEVESLDFLYECKLCLQYKNTIGDHPWETN